MKTKTLKQTLQDHNNKIQYRKTTITVYIGGMVTGIMAWEFGAIITDMIIKIIN